MMVWRWRGTDHSQRFITHVLIVTLLRYIGREKSDRNHVVIYDDLFSSEEKKTLLILNMN